MVVKYSEKSFGVVNTQVFPPHAPHPGDKLLRWEITQGALGVIAV